MAKSGNIVLYVGGRWEQRWQNDNVILEWVRGKKLYSAHYHSRAKRLIIIERWHSMFDTFEVGIVPDTRKQIQKPERQYAAANYHTVTR